MYRRALALLFCLGLSWAWAAAGRAASKTEVPSDSPWAEVLSRHHHEGGLDYATLKQDRAPLDTYLGSLREARPASWDRAVQIAFWCNAYNAVVSAFVLERFPQLASVKEVPGFFDERRIRVAGSDRTLDEIEGEARALGDPRVHFAVVCASTSCPDLRPEPYRAASLEQQLEDATRRFLADPEKGMRWEKAAGVLHLSSIFKWYAGDFTGGSTVVAFFVRGKILDWVLPHLPTELAAELRSREPAIRYLDYDWSLNHRPRR